MNRIFGWLLLAAMPLAGQYYRREPGPEQLVERVQFDLSRAFEHSYARGRIEHARHELGEFQARRAAGGYARHELDSAIGALNKVVRGDGVDPRDRDVLARDLADLRIYRSRSIY